MSTLIVAWLCSLGPPAQADPVAAAEPEAAVREAAQEGFRSDAAKYRIVLGAGMRELTLLERPVLGWSNPARNGEDGVCFVWLLDGRPEVIGSMFTYTTRGVMRTKHLFHSLAAGPLSADFGDLRVWAPTGPGVQFKPVPGSPAPAEQPRLRLVQMKALARQFSARLVDQQGKAAELRLMPQPLYRYQPKASEVRDGAIFAFAYDRDPEALLLLEARGPADAPQWNYALARFHFVDLWASHQGQEVWHVEALPVMKNLYLGMREMQDSPYLSVLKRSDPQ
jgi:hypothetical protein